MAPAPPAWHSSFSLWPRRPSSPAPPARHSRLLSLRLLSWQKFQLLGPPLYEPASLSACADGHGILWLLHHLRDTRASAFGDSNPHLLHRMHKTPQASQHVSWPQQCPSLPARHAMDFEDLSTYDKSFLFNPTKMRRSDTNVSSWLHRAWTERRAWERGCASCRVSSTVKGKTGAPWPRGGCRWCGRRAP